MNTNLQLAQLTTRIRSLRESRHLTLVEAAAKSQGAISAMALGSYERGDRAISAEKIFILAQMYGVPVTEIFMPPEKSVSDNRVTIDIRKLVKSETQQSVRLSQILLKISQLRRDWNGEVISLRSEDMKHLALFAGFTPEEIENIVRDFEIPRSK